jgi:disulfide oxidoreductase YuzD
MFKKSKNWLLLVLMIVAYLLSYVVYEDAYSTRNVEHRNTGVVISFNIHHPELKPGEIWLTNATHESYERIGWTTKRAGNIAYDIYGEKAGEMTYGFYADEAFFPVFVQESELVAAGIDVEKLKKGEVHLSEMEPEDYLTRPRH